MPLVGSQITPGMVIALKDQLYRVESAVKVTLKGGDPIVKTKLKNLLSEETLEKNFKQTDEVEEVFLSEGRLEYLYLEGKNYLFLDIDKLVETLVPPTIVGEEASFLKEGVEVKAIYYGDKIFSIELPQFLELMVVKCEDSNEKLTVSNATKIATLETGAKIPVPLFIEVGDVIKVDTKTSEYIQRI